jgi:pyrimidine deaminase RibD-like protein
MARAVEEARRQAERYGVGEGKERPDPLVGCVVVTHDGRVESGYRGEKYPDDHAEFTVLQKKGLLPADLKGATVFTTLEPCTKRGKEKVPCADRLVEAGVRRVVIGYMDPDDRARGYQKLVEAGIAIDHFDDDFARQIRTLNLHFIESRKQSSLRRPWFEEVESACRNRVRILADLAEAPRMNRLGGYPFPEELLSEYETRRTENDCTSGGWNEQIAEYRGLRRFGAVLDYEEYSYVQWKTLRDAGRKPRAVYAGAVLVCPERACLYVHKRSQDVATEPGKRHGFLGGFIVDHQNNRDETLLHACLRELHEESSAQPNLDASRVVVVENLNIGWIDVMFMAGVISSSNAGRLKGSKEGEVLALGFDQLEEQLAENSDAWGRMASRTTLSGFGLDLQAHRSGFRKNRGTSTIEYANSYACKLTTRYPRGATMTILDSLAHLCDSLISAVRSRSGCNHRVCTGSRDSVAIHSDGKRRSRGCARRRWPALGESFRFAQALYDDKDAYKRHHRFYWNGVLSGMGNRSLVRNLVSQEHGYQMTMGSKNEAIPAFPRSTIDGSGGPRAAGKRNRPGDPVLGPRDEAASLTLDRAGHGAPDATKRAWPA